MNIGDKVINTNSNRIGIIFQISESGSISVLENISPLVINTHDNEKTLRVIEPNCLSFFDKKNN